ncbi:MAG: hypothetical protein ABIZ49_09245 [Opitutaceae bacterium]
MNSLAAQTRLILRNDLRLLWRDLRSGRMKEYLSVGLFVVLFCIFNAIAIGIFFAFRQSPPLGAETLAWLFFGFLMLGAAMNQAIVVLFERADFDLLLPSPVSPRAILLARLATVTVGAALAVAMFLLPLLNGALLAVSWRYAAGYLVWLLLSGAVASAGVWFTLLLVKWLGPRRARTWAQVVAAVLGASVYLVTQSQQFLHGRGDASGRVFGQIVEALAQPPVSFIAQAGRGDPLALLALAGLTAVFAGLTTRLLGRMFVGGVQEAGAIVPKRRSRAGRRHVFTEGVVRATFWKDVRLIARDPLLLAQVLPTALYILPGLFGISRLGGVGLLAPLALFLTGMFSLSLTAVAASGEECWDLIRMSPTPELRLRVAKMAAGMALPLVLCVVLCAVMAFFGRPWLALLTLIFSAGCAAGGSWLHVARIKPTPRRDVMKRGERHNYGRGFVAAIILMLGAGGLGFAAAGSWKVAAVLLGATVLAVIACFALVDLEEVHGRDFAALESGRET